MFLRPALKLHMAAGEKQSYFLTAAMEGRGLPGLAGCRVGGLPGCLVAALLGLAVSEFRGLVGVRAPRDCETNR
jgi:hypothetical protein